MLVVQQIQHLRSRKFSRFSPENSKYGSAGYKLALHTQVVGSGAANFLAS